MIKTISLLLAFALAIAIAPVWAAPDAASQLEIIDVLPSVDEDQRVLRPSGFMACDFLVGAQNRPAWWGQTFGVKMGDTNARLEWKRGTQSGQAEKLSGTITDVQWQEGLGLYLFHARVNWDAKKCPTNATYTLKGELPALLPRNAPLPFTLSFASPSKAQFPRATLLAPQAQVWVRSIRVARREGYQKYGPPNFEYEARITVVNRRVEKQSESRYGPQIFDATGKEPSFSGTYGLEGGLESDQNFANQLIVNSGVEFLTYRVVFTRGVFESSPNLSFRQTLAYNGRAPLTVAFPVKRDGQLLTGEIAPRDWTVER